MNKKAQSVKKAKQPKKRGRLSVSIGRCLIVSTERIRCPLCLQMVQGEHRCEGKQFTIDV